QQALCHARHLGVAVTRLDPHQAQQPGPDRADGFPVYADAGMGHALDQGKHGKRGFRSAASDPCIDLRDGPPCFRLPVPVRRLPWPLLHRLGNALAAVWARLDARESRVARANLDIAYPQMLPAERAAWHREILRTTARQFLETLRFWTRPHAHNLALITREHG